MIYTVGNRESYAAAFADTSCQPLLKTGPCVMGTEKYFGGIAFPSTESAHQYLREIGKVQEWTVFGLKAEWTADTYQLDGETFRRINRDCELVNLNA